MGIDEMRNKAKEYAIEAVKCDKLEEYEKAYDLYVTAANQLQQLMKYDQNPDCVRVYKERAKDYVLRAKEIKEKKLNKKDDNKDKEANEEQKKLEKLLRDQIKELQNQLDEERKKNKILFDENMKLNDYICKLNLQLNSIENYEIKTKSIENNIQEKNEDPLQNDYNFNLPKNQNDYSITSKKSGEKIMTVNFVSMGTQDIGHYSLACRKTDLFIRLEEKLINDFPVLRESDLYFEVNVRRIKRYKTLEENNIKNNDIINLFLIDS